MTEPAAWLLDTNVVSEMMRSKPEPLVAGYLDQIAPEGIGLAAITVWEIFNGIGQLEVGSRREDIAHRFQNLLDEIFEHRIFDWTADDAKFCAKIMEDKRRLGESLDAHLPDAMLAGTAIRSGCGVVTRNESEFRNTGIDIVNPWAVEFNPGK